MFRRLLQHIRGIGKCAMIPERASPEAPSPQSRPSVIRYLLVASTVLAFLALSFALQLQLYSGPLSTELLLKLLILGIPTGAILAFGIRRPSLPSRWTVPRSSPRLLHVTYVLVAAASASSAAAALLVQIGSSSSLAVVLWVLGMVAAVIAACDRHTAAALRDSVLAVKAWRWQALALATILAVAAALRLVNLATIPGFMHFDEANDALQARAILDGQVPSIFTISSWSQLPMLVHVWYAMFQGVFGDSLVAQRLGSVALGLLSIIAVALLGSELFNWRAGLLAAALLSVSHDNIHFSRVGIQVISGDLAVPLTFYFFIRTLRRGSRLSAVATGFMLTFDIHAYFGSRICFIILPIYVLALLLTGYRSVLAARLRLLSWAAFGCLVSAAPIGVYILHNWAVFMGHSEDETIFSNLPDIQIQLTALFGTHDLGYMLRTELWRTVQTLFYAGDGGLQYGATYPMIDPISSALLPAAVCYSFFQFRKPRYSICLISFVSVLVVGGAMTINMPYWPRLVVLVPIISLLIAALIDDLWTVLEQVPYAVIPSSVCAVLLLLAIAYGNYHWYFGEYVPTSRQNGMAAPMDIGNFLRSRGTVYAVGLSAGDLYMNDEVIRFLAPKAITCTLFNDVDAKVCPRVPKGGDYVFIAPSAVGLIPRLEQRYPHGTLSRFHTYTVDETYWLYRI